MTSAMVSAFSVLGVSQCLAELAGFEGLHAGPPVPSARRGDHCDRACDPQKWNSTLKGAMTEEVDPSERHCCRLQIAAAVERPAFCQQQDAPDGFLRGEQRYPLQIRVPAVLLVPFLEDAKQNWQGRRVLARREKERRLLDCRTD